MKGGMESGALPTQKQTDQKPFLISDRLHKRGKPMKERKNHRLGEKGPPKDAHTQIKNYQREKRDNKER